MSKISDPHLFEAVFEVVQRELRLGTAPTVMAFPGQTSLVRHVNKADLYNNYSRTFDPSKLPSRLTPHDAGKDIYRFTGVGPRGPLADRGGLYTAFSMSAMTAELWHYTTKTSVPRAFDSRAVISLGVYQPLQCLELSAGSVFLQKIESSRNVQAALKSSPLGHQTLFQLMRHPHDYTVSRAIGIAAAQDRVIDGLLVPSARETDREGETGNNCVLYGPDNQPLHRKVRAETVSLLDYNGKTHEATPTIFRLDFDLGSKSYKVRT